MDPLAQVTSRLQGRIGGIQQLGVGPDPGYPLLDRFDLSQRGGEDAGVRPIGPRYCAAILRFERLGFAQTVDQVLSMLGSSGPANKSARSQTTPALLWDCTSVNYQSLTQTLDPQSDLRIGSLGG